jgi:hypothetical protein
MVVVLEWMEVNSYLYNNVHLEMSSRARENRLKGFGV